MQSSGNGARVGVVACLLLASLSLARADLFLRGDASGDGLVDVRDGLAILDCLFREDATVLPCLDAADLDDNGRLRLNDAILLFEFVFRDGSPPPAPFLRCGEDPTDDALGCERFEPCRGTFYGRVLEADAVFFVIAGSASMRDSGELQVARRELTRVLRTLPDGVEFAIILFDSRIRSFPQGEQPARAPDDITEAVKFVGATPGGSGSCLRAALQAALNFARASSAERRMLVLVSGKLRGVFFLQLRLEVTLQTILDELGINLPAC